VAASATQRTPRQTSPGRPALFSSLCCLIDRAGDGGNGDDLLGTLNSTQAVGERAEDEGTADPILAEADLARAGPGAPGWTG
jgi:hypothetical protein